MSLKFCYTYLMAPKGKKKSFMRWISFFVVILVFSSGFLFATYLSLSTNIFPINYQKKVKQLYIKEKKDHLSEVYIDLANEFLFSYPKYFLVDEGYYSRGKIMNGENSGNSILLTILFADIEFQLQRYQLDNNQSILEFAKKSEIFPYQNLRNVSYSQTSINGKQAVIAEFIVTEEQKEIESFVRGGVIKVIDEPVGFKGKIVYIKNNNDVYVWKAGLVEKLGLEKDFDKIVNSFKFFN